jgi:hypothetical protein
MCITDIAANLKQKCGFTCARFAADKHTGPLYNTATKHTVKFFYTGFYSDMVIISFYIIQLLKSNF